MKVIVYKQDSGQIVIVYPTPEALNLFGIDLIAQKDVPNGKPYKIIDIESVPEHRESRQLWDIPDEEFTDGFGAEWSTFEKILK